MIIFFFFIKRLENGIEVCVSISMKDRQIHRTDRLTKQTDRLTKRADRHIERSDRHTERTHRLSGVTAGGHGGHVLRSPYMRKDPHFI